MTTPVCRRARSGRRGQPRGRIASEDWRSLPSLIDQMWAARLTSWTGVSCGYGSVHYLSPVTAAATYATHLPRAITRCARRSLSNTTRSASTRGAILPQVSASPKSPAAVSTLCPGTLIKSLPRPLETAPPVLRRPPAKLQARLNRFGVRGVHDGQSRPRVDERTAPLGEPASPIADCDRMLATPVDRV